MLTKWILGNFKSVASPVELSLAPITIFAGANSSGKSTVLQSILMIAQTFQDVLADAYPIVFNGNFIRLGAVQDVLHASSSESEIDIGFELDPEPFPPLADKQSKISLRFSLSAGEEISREHPYGVLKTLVLRTGQDYLSLWLVEENYKDVARHHNNLFISPEIEAQIHQFSYVVRESSFRFRYLSPFQPQFRLRGFLPSQHLETYDHVNFFTKKALMAAVEYLSNTADSTDESVLVETDIHDALRETVKNRLLGVLRSGDRGGATQYYGVKSKFIRFARDKERSVTDLLRLIRKDMPGPYRSRLAKEIRADVDKIRLRTKNVHLRDMGVRLGSIPELEATAAFIENFFKQKIYYIGPLREPPQYIYLLPPSPGYQYVGTKGEFAPTVLEHFKGAKVDFPLPPGRQAKTKVENGPLIYALQIWLEHMGLLSKVTTEDLGKAGTKLSVQMPGIGKDLDLDLTSVGVGVSQVLPVLVGCLLAPRGTVFLLEQPELHLHPKVQAILADFFLGLTKVGKQVLVETHSEYLINRLRRRVAEDQTDHLAEDIQIYFVEREKGETHFRRLDLNVFGAVVEWPKGFFDEGPSEAQMIMEAAMRKRRQKRSGRRGN